MDPLQEVADEEAATGEPMSDDDSVAAADEATSSSAIAAQEVVDSGLDMALARALATGRWTRSAGLRNSLP